MRSQTAQLLPLSDADVPLVKQWAAREDLQEYFRRFGPSFSWGGAGSLAGTYLVTVDDKKVGLVNLCNFNQLSRSVEFGLAVTPETPKRRAVAVEVCQQLGEYVFNYLGCNKLFCLVLPHREDLEQLLKSFSFELEGTLRQNVFWNGEFHDEKVFSLLAEQYRRLP